ncbi:pyridoxal phosphate-dependent transferase [Crepidotus variabilis]|uniref:Pyridoxal phosphate-dependent transferase n=1 Tax=Crepidotus variabilis TaxID=179855 RepID=A0A9P6JIX1_9AGAR|nr:pyridoxal phosphate-dependent transferase [Crepidotus variabilis]
MAQFDPTHHLSRMSKSRKVSPVQGLHKFLGTPGLISLSGGLPNPEYFPFGTLTAEVSTATKFSEGNDTTASHKPPRLADWFWSFFPSSNGSEMTSSITVPKYANRSQPDALQLSTALQYSSARGLPLLNSLCREITAKVHSPAALCDPSNILGASRDILLTTGNTDAWIKCVQTFCNPREAVLCDDWTFSTSLEGMRPYQVGAVPVKMDSQGMCSTDLREILEAWNETERGYQRPHVMYIVPIGQNPTGSTMGSLRKQEIYQVCVEYDILIIEDDPYFFLQFNRYCPPSERLELKNTDESYIQSLSPSFLR